MPFPNPSKIIESNNIKSNSEDQGSAVIDFFVQAKSIRNKYFAYLAKAIEKDLDVPILTENEISIKLNNQSFNFDYWLLVDEERRTWTCDIDISTLFSDKVLIYLKGINRNQIFITLSIFQSSDLECFYKHYGAEAYCDYNGHSKLQDHTSFDNELYLNPTHLDLKSLAKAMRELVAKV